jgi:hypothetical protein
MQELGVVAASRNHPAHGPHLKFSIRPSQNSKNLLKPPVFHTQYLPDNPSKTVFHASGMDSAWREGVSLNPRSGQPAGHAQPPPGDARADFLIFDPTHTLKGGWHGNRWSLYPLVRGVIN